MRIFIATLFLIAVNGFAATDHPRLNEIDWVIIAPHSNVKVISQDLHTCKDWALDQLSDRSEARRLHFRFGDHVTTILIGNCLGSGDYEGYPVEDFCNMEGTNVLSQFLKVEFPWLAGSRTRRRDQVDWLMMMRPLAEGETAPAAWFGLCDN